MSTSVIKKQSNAIGKGTYTSRLLDCYGYITSSTTKLWVTIPLLTTPDVSSINVTSAKSDIRLPSGGYIGGSANADITSYYENSTFVSAQGAFELCFTNSNGWSTTNNIPVVGYLTLSFTLS